MAGTRSPFSTCHTQHTPGHLVYNTLGHLPEPVTHNRSPFSTCHMHKHHLLHTTYQVTCHTHLVIVSHKTQGQASHTTRQTFTCHTQYAWSPVRTSHVTPSPVTYKTKSPVRTCLIKHQVTCPVFFFHHYLCML